MTNHHLAIIDDYQRHHGGIFSKKEKVKYVITLPQTYNQSLLLRANVTDVTIKDKLEVQNLEIDTQVGAIEINQLVSSKATIKNNIGDIAINQIEGALIINSDIGDVDIEHFLVKGNSQILVNTGDIDIQIADSSNCIIRAKSKLGNNNQTVPKTLNQGLYTLSVTSNIGDIDIET